MGLGGWDGTATQNDLWAFEFSTESWKRIFKFCDVAPRYRHSAVIYNNFMVIFGGVDHYHIRYNDIHVLNLMDMSWRRVIVSSDSPSPRTFHKAIQNSAFMFVVGGFDGEKLNDIWKINLKDVVFHTWNDPNKITGKKSNKTIKTKPIKSSFIANQVRDQEIYQWKEIQFKKESNIPECLIPFIELYLNTKCEN